MKRGLFWAILTQMEGLSCLSRWFYNPLHWYQSIQLTIRSQFCIW
jgi:hypothetical protein